VAAPNLRLIDDDEADKMKSYVAAGGVLLLTDRAGTQHTDCSMRRILSPGVFTEIAGVVSVAKLDLLEYGAAHGQMDSPHEEELGIAFAGNNLVFKPRTIMEQLQLRGAETVATFRGGRMDGWPAVTRARYRKGWVIYAGTDSGDRGFHEAVAQLAADAAQLPALLSVPRGVVVTTREDARYRYYFVLNLTETPHDAIALPQPMEDWASGGQRLTSLRLEPLGVALLAVEKQPQNALRGTSEKLISNETNEVGS
jgi:beta-galactosidase